MLLSILDTKDLARQVAFLNPLESSNFDHPKMSNESKKSSNKKQRVALQTTCAPFPPIHGIEQAPAKKSKNTVETPPEKIPYLARIRNETNDSDRFVPDTGRLRPGTGRLRPGTGRMRPSTAQFKPDIGLIGPKSGRSRLLMKQGGICLPAIPTDGQGKGACVDNGGMPILPTPKHQEVPHLPCIRKSREKSREKPFPKNCIQQYGYYSDDELPRQCQPPNTPSGFELPPLVPPEPGCIEIEKSSRFYQVSNDSGCSISCNERESNATLLRQGSLHNRCETLPMNHGTLPPRPPTPATTHGILPSRPSTRSITCSMPPLRPPTQATTHDSRPPTQDTTCVMVPSRPSTQSITSGMPPIGPPTQSTTQDSRPSTQDKSHDMLPPRPPTQDKIHDILPPRPPTQATTQDMLPPRPLTQATTHDMLPPRPPTRSATRGVLPPRPPTGRANATTMKRNSRRYGAGKKSFH